MRACCLPRWPTPMTAVRSIEEIRGQRLEIRIERVSFRYCPNLKVYLFKGVYRSSCISTSPYLIALSRKLKSSANRHTFDSQPDLGLRKTNLDRLTSDHRPLTTALSRLYLQRSMLAKRAWHLLFITIAA